MKAVLGSVSSAKKERNCFHELRRDRHSGSSRSTGRTAIEKYSYDAYGAPTTTYTGGVFNNRFKFTGREYATSFGVYEYRNRAYHPGLGRFVSEDPTGFAGGDYNLFRYCENDPVNQTDPMGLESGPVPVARLNLTSSGKGDWVFDQRNISYSDEMQHRQPAGMNGGSSGNLIFAQVQRSETTSITERGHLRIDTDGTGNTHGNRHHQGHTSAMMNSQGHLCQGERIKSDETATAILMPTGIGI